MDLGPALESDHAELVDMLCLAYRPDLRPRFAAQVKDDCTYELHQSRIGKVDGKIVSYTRVSDRPIYVAGRVVRMGGIGAVSTHPDYRGRGYNSLVLQDAVRYMEEEGYDISMLFTGVSGHYGKQGWVPFPEHSISVAPASEPGRTGQRSQPTFRLKGAQGKRRDTWEIRPFEEKRDLDEVVQIYEKHCRPRNGTAVRNPDYWRCGHSRFMGVMPNLVVAKGRKLAAYLKCGASSEAVSVAEVGYLPECPEVVWSMARYLVKSASENGAREISFRLGRVHPLPEAVCEISNGRMSHSEGEGMMLRLINLPSLLRKIAPGLRRHLKRSGLPAARASVAFVVDGQCATVKIEDGKLTVEEGAKGRAKLPLDMRTMLRMILGHSTFNQMADLHQVHGVKVSARAAAILDALFPPGDLVYWGCDHF